MSTNLAAITRRLAAIEDRAANDHTALDQTIHWQATFERRLAAVEQRQADMAADYERRIARLELRASLCGGES